ncbi:esterase-like activity of phytase family protein [Peribacillus simplex]|uniref:esterase-like activity of phytase family protein n=1 Tax=Peribacillus simplex TaxID=1478 RepID=UPI003334E985
MKRIFAASLCTTLLASSLLAGTASAKSNIDVKKYSVSVNSHLFAPAHDSVSDVFPYGFVGGFGSALAFKSYDKKTGEYEFYALTDRGPNGDAPTYLENGQASASKYFLSPAFKPQIGILKIKKGKAQINESIKLKNKNNSYITGLPIAPGKTGSSLEIPLLPTMEKLNYDPNGMDPEGIAVDKQGDFWISDEYGPFIAKFSNKGQLVQKLQPGNGLPEILKYRIPNRGMEGLSISPSGKVFSSVQSILDINGETNNALFTRIVVFDPKSNKTKMYAYPVNMSKFKKAMDLKIGDIFAVSDKQLLVIEQGKDINGEMRNVINLVDLTKATDLTNKKVNGKELETINDPAELKKLNIQMASTKEILNLREHGWDMEKAEGLTLLPDRKTLAIVNDNDFGVAVSTDNGEKITDLSYDSLTKKWTLDSKEIPTNVKFSANSPTERKNVVWLFTIPELTKLLK